MGRSLYVLLFVLWALPSSHSGSVTAGAVHSSAHPPTESPTLSTGGGATPSERAQLTPNALTAVGHGGVAISAISLSTRDNVLQQLRTSAAASTRRARRSTAPLPGNPASKAPISSTHQPMLDSPSISTSASKTTDHVGPPPSTAPTNIVTVTTSAPATTGRLVPTTKPKENPKPPTGTASPAPTSKAPISSTHQPMLDSPQSQPLPPRPLTTWVRPHHRPYQHCHRDDKCPGNHRQTGPHNKAEGKP
ncbi:hypothetical protein AAFF_G00213530 [Aldrovandia affinis]|uniref:Uncharacterized protein n=1 Tax=Aldrovandia affinis TaxID=143900 RepID=A0AAD7RH06_9TELE|nr:hypothetical protein AAFF_G00213530 [Aldrovandia affinis]